MRMRMNNKKSMSMTASCERRRVLHFCTKDRLRLVDGLWRVAARSARSAQMYGCLNSGANSTTRHASSSCLVISRWKTNM